MCLPDLWLLYIYKEHFGIILMYKFVSKFANKWQYMRYNLEFIGS